MHNVIGSVYDKRVRLGISSGPFFSRSDKRWFTFCMKVKPIAI